MPPSGAHIATFLSLTTHTAGLPTHQGKGLPFDNLHWNSLVVGTSRYHTLSGICHGGSKHVFTYLSWRALQTKSRDKYCSHYYWSFGCCDFCCHGDNEHQCYPQAASIYSFPPHPLDRHSDILRSPPPTWCQFLQSFFLEVAPPCNYHHNY